MTPAEMKIRAVCAELGLTSYDLRWRTTRAGRPYEFLLATLPAGPIFQSSSVRSLCRSLRRVFGKPPVKTP